MIALLSGSPGTIGVVPFFFVFSASSRMSSRSPAIRDFESNPWQRKHVSDMIGRISRLNLTGFSAAWMQIAVVDSASTTRLASLDFILATILVGFTELS